MSKEGIGLNVDGYGIYGFLEDPGNARKLIIFSHGFTGNLDGPDGMFVKLSNKLHNAGYATLRFNYRGTPPSGMDFRNMSVKTKTRDLMEVIAYARSEGFDEICLLGESLGGTIITEAYDPNICAMIYWYSDFDFDTDIGFSELRKEANRKLISDRGSVHLWEGFSLGPGLFQELCEFGNNYEKVRSITCPTLFMHGDMDTDVPPEQSQRAFDLATCPKDLIWISGVDHCFRHPGKKLHPKQDEAIELTLRWIKKNF